MSLAAVGTFIATVVNVVNPYAYYTSWLEDRDKDRQHLLALETERRKERICNVTAATILMGLGATTIALGSLLPEETDPHRRPTAIGTGIGGGALIFAGGAFFYKTISNSGNSSCCTPTLAP